MIGLDTNVLVRYIMQDDAGQSPQATALVESLTVETPGFVPLVSVIELTWVLTACFGLDRSQIVAALEGLMRSREIVVERADIVWQSVRVFGMALPISRTALSSAPPHQPDANAR